MESRPTPSRGRARTRARATSAEPIQHHGSPPSSGSSSPKGNAEADSSVYQHMYQEGSNGNGDSNGNGSNGNGSSNASNNGDGSSTPRGRGSPLESRGGTPRILSPKGSPARTDRAMDFVVSKPEGFVKTVPILDPSKQLDLIANYYELRTIAGPHWHLYSIKIKPELTDERAIRRAVGSYREQIGTYWRTGLQLYSVKELGDRRNVYETSVKTREDPGGEQIYEVTLDYVREVSENETVIMQFYNGISRGILKSLNYEIMGRHYFDPTGKKDFPKWKLSLWPGFQNSIRQQERDTLLNVESVWKVVRTESVLQIITDIIRRFPQGQNHRDVVNQEIVGLVVVTPHNSKSYKISKVDWEQNPESTFTMRDGTRVSFMSYYETRHNKTIKDRKQPLLISEPTLRQIRLGHTQITLVPELCYPCGLTDQIRSNFSLMKDIGGTLHMAPTERVRTMQAFVNKAINSEDVAAVMRGWGALEPTPVSVPGRRFPPEKLVVGRGADVVPDDKTSDFTIGLRGKAMLLTVDLKQWAIVVTHHDSKGIDDLIRTMQKVATPMQFKISKPIIVPVSDARNYVNGVSDAYSKLQGKPDMIMVVLATNNADNYAAVKKRCSIDYGIPSQCFLSKNIQSKGLMSIATKLVIQMNAKLGGEPWGVSNPLHKKNLMVLGYDVHHAGPAGGKSIGAMTATMSNLGQYYSCVNQVKSGIEVETGVAELFAKCLDAYKKKTGQLPGWIIMYRDGVGEGQLQDVYKMELKGFKDRIAAAYAGQELPKLAFIIVNKRITTRLFLKAGINKYDNPLPGTVVDDVVTRPERYDFFLIAATARQGCVSPTYYNVLMDETDLAPDKLQRFTYKLCFMYFNWSGTVAVPAPCQNAHKLALLVGTALKRPAKDTLSHLLHFL